MKNAIIEREFGYSMRVTIQREVLIMTMGNILDRKKNMGGADGGCHEKASRNEKSIPRVNHRDLPLPPSLFSFSFSLIFPSIFSFILFLFHSHSLPPLFLFFLSLPLYFFLSLSLHLYSLPLSYLNPHTNTGTGNHFALSYKKKKRKLNIPSPNTKHCVIFSLKTNSQIPRR